MVTFDATGPGTPAATWAESGILDSRPSLDLAPYSAVLVVAAHPDDETLGAGGLMSVAAQAGLDVHVVVVTDGSASHPASRTHSPSMLAAARAAEVERAVRIVAPAASVDRLDYDDGQTERDRAAIAAELELIIAAMPSTCVIVAPWLGDGHPDHHVVGELCVELSAGRTVLAYPIWMWHWAEPSMPHMPWNRLLRLELDDRSLSAKREAIDAHATQIQPLGPDEGDETLLSSAMLEHFRGPREWFLPSEPSLGAGYFEAMYERDGDPWRFESRWYEARKRAITLASLPRERYASALEIGCSIGVLTRDLATRCDHLLAIDISEAAVDAARARVHGIGDVTVEVGDVSSSMPRGPFDLVVVSEVGYYLSADELGRVVARVREQLAVDATVLVCHWRHPVADYPLAGDDVHAVVGDRLGLPRIARHDEADFLLEVYTTDGVSVGEAEGLA